MVGSWAIRPQWVSKVAFGRPDEPLVGDKRTMDSDDAFDIL